jgi:hypothetical protein
MSFYLDCLGSTDNILNFISQDERIVELKLSGSRYGELNLNPLPEQQKFMNNGVMALDLEGPMRITPILERINFVNLRKVCFKSIEITNEAI